MTKRSPNNPEQNQNIDRTVIEGSNVNQNQVNVTIQTAKPEAESEPHLTRQEYRNRQALLDKVRQFWLEGVLDNSLSSRARIELGLEQRFDVLNLDYTTPEKHRQALPKGIKVSNKFFDQLGMGRTLLILGNPGSGKTTTLLELTRDLIERAEQDVNLPIPIVLNLASWTDTNQKIFTWVIQELNTKYQVSKSISQTWLKNQQLFLLLDGLDEVSSERRDACINAVNRFHQDYGQTEIVVCCRITDYENLPSQLRFRGAIFIQPLTFVQIADYLAQAGEALASVRKAIEIDNVLREIAQSPLMLSIIALAYQGATDEELPTTNLDETRRRLFETYIKQMLHRRGRSKFYKKEQTLRWLNWLAKEMLQESQTIFLIERLQPTWLKTPLQKWAYTLGLGVTLGLIFTLLLGPIINWFSHFIDVSAPINYLLVAGLSAGLIWGTASMYLGTSIFKASNQLLLGIIGALFWGFYVSLFGNPVTAYLGSGLTYGLLLGLFSGVLNSSIQITEALRWSWSNAKEGARDGLVIGLLTGLISGFLFGFIYTINTVSSFPAILLACLIFSLISGLAFELAGGLIGGIIRGVNKSEIKTKIFPNQGVWQLAKNSAILSAVAALFFGGLLKIIGLSELSGALFGILIVLLIAGSECIKHLILRLSLCIGGLSPWNYAHFLDYCVNCIFLQKVGGGYIFIHRSLMEYFATSNQE